MSLYLSSSGSSSILIGRRICHHILLLQLLCMMMIMMMQLKSIEGFIAASTYTIKRGGFVPQPQLQRHSMIDLYHTATTSLSLSSLSLSNNDDNDDDSITTVRNVINWIQDESLDNIVSKDDAITICYELLNDKELINELEVFVTDNWDKIINKLLKRDAKDDNENEKEQKQTLAQLIGTKTTEQLLDSIENIDLYSDSKTVNSFLESNAIQELFAQTLYDGIYEFFQTFDVFGNIISKLPVLGPIRNKIRDDLKKQLDNTLGPSLRNFLKGYTSIAIGRASTFILSDTNKKQFNKANKRLIESILYRPLSDLLEPLSSSNDSIVKLRIEFFDYLRQLSSSDDDKDGDDTDTDTIINDYITFIYDIIGDKSISSVGFDINRILDSSPTLESTSNQILQKIISESSSNK
jgi:hypothetical protein